MRPVYALILAFYIQGSAWAKSCDLTGTSLNSSLQDLAEFSEAMKPESVLWSTPVHAKLLDLAFSNGSKLCKAQMNLGSLSADSLQYQRSKYAFMHAMRGEGELVEDAKKKMDAFLIKQYVKVRNHLKNFQRTSHESDYLRACFRRGFALHPIMDSTSPVHAGFQVWHPFHIDSLFKHGDISETLQENLGVTLGIPHSDEDMESFKKNTKLKLKTIKLMQETDARMRQEPRANARRE